MIQTLEQSSSNSSGAELTNPADEEIMEMIQRQVHHGLNLLHQRYAPLLRTISMRMLHNTADAEDLVQDVLVEIWDKAPGYDPAKGRPLAWISTLTRRRSIDRLRQREAYRRLEERLIAETNGCSEGWTHVHEQVARDEATESLGRALATLPEAQRYAIHLAYYTQMSQREIHAHTGIPLGTVKTRLDLGLKKLARYFSEREDLLPLTNECRKRNTSHILQTLRPLAR